MLDHVTLQVADLPACTAFYDAVVPALGASQLQDLGRAVGYGVDRPSLWISVAPSREDASGIHVALAAADHDAVVAFWKAATDQGAESLREPGTWAEFHESYFGAIVRDPGGNTVEAVCLVTE